VGSGLVAIFVGAWHLVVRWAKRHEERQAIKFAAVEARLKVLEADSHLVALKIAKLEMIADQVENLSSRLEAGFAGLNTRLDGIAMMRQPSCASKADAGPAFVPNALVGEQGLSSDLRGLPLEVVLL
jgi:hypothetical protein